MNNKHSIQLAVKNLERFKLYLLDMGIQLQIQFVQIDGEEQKEIKTEKEIEMGNMAEPILEEKRILLEKNGIVIAELAVKATAKETGKTLCLIEFANHHILPEEVKSITEMIELYPDVDVSLDYSERARLLLFESFALMDDGNYDKALKICDEVLTLDPKFARAWNLKGLILVALNRLQQGIDCFLKAVEFDPGLIRAWKNMGDAYLDMEKSQEAEACFKKAVELNPNPQFWDDWQIKGQAFQNLGKHDDAIMCFSKAIEINPADYEAWVFKGHSLMNLNKNEEALTNIEKALAINSGYFYAKTHKANCLNSMGRFEEAIACYDSILQEYPEHVPTLINKGYCFRCLEQFELAMKCFNKALEIEPDNSFTLGNLGEIHLMFDRYQDALPLFDTILKNNPDDLDAQAYRGNCLEGIERYEEAITCYNTILQKYPNHVVVLNKKGSCLKFLKQFEAALECFNKALEIEPKNSFALGNIGQILIMFYQYQDALPLFDTILKNNPDDLDAQAYRGNCLKGMKQFEEAIACYNIILQKYPNHVVTLNNKGFCFECLEQFESALECFNKALEIEPKNSFALRNIGQILLMFDRYQDALPLFESILQNNPDSLDAQWNKGNCLKHLGQFEEAIVCYDEILQKYPNHVETLNNKGDCLQSLGKFKAAHECFNKVLEIEPQNSFALKNIGHILLMFNRYIDALPLFESILQNNFDDLEAKAYKGDCLKGMGEFKEAIACYGAFLQENPDNVLARNNLGYCLRRLGEFESALKNFSLVLAIEPDNLFTLNQKGKCLQKIGNYDEALICYEKLLTLDPENEYIKNHKGLSPKTLSQIKLAEDLLNELIGDHDLLSAKKKLSQMSFLDKHQLPPLLERLDLIYGNRIEVIRSYINIPEFQKNIKNCIRILTLAIDAMDDEEEDTTEFLVEILECFFIILEEIYINNNQSLKHDIDLNIYILLLFLKLPFFTDAKEEKIILNKFSQLFARLENPRLMNDIIGTLENLIQNSLHSNNQQDNDLNEPSFEKKAYLKKTGGLSMEDRYHYLVELYIEILRNYLSFEKWTVFDLSSLVNGFDCYIVYHLKKNEEKLPADQDFLKNCIVLYYLIKENKDLERKLSKYSFFQQVSDFLVDYFNKKLIGELLYQEEKKLQRSILANHLDYLSNCFYNVGSGDMGLFLQLASLMTKRSYPSFIQRFTECQVFITPQNIIHHPPLIFDHFLPNLIITNYIYYIEENLYLNMDISPLIKTLIDFEKNPLFASIKNDIHWIVTFYTYYLHMIRPNMAMPQDDTQQNPPPLTDLKCISYELQYTVCIKMLIHIFENWDNFIFVWGKLSEELQERQGEDFLKKTFSEDIQNAFVNFATIFQTNIRVQDSISIGLSILLQEILLLLNSIPFSKFENELKNRNFEFQNSITRLFQFIVQYVEKIENFFLLYQLLKLSDRYTYFIDKKLINPQLVQTICSRISGLIHSHYKTIPIFFWDYRDKNIIDEINVLMERSRIELQKRRI